MQVIRSAFFALGMAVSVVFIALLALFFLPFSFSLRYRLISQWARFNIWWLAKTCRLYYQVEGVENIPQRNGVVLCKHQSAWETLALQQIFPPQVWLLKRELLMIPFFGWGLAMLEPIAINRAAGRQAIRQLKTQGQKRLDDGRWVIIYPEGSRIAPGKKGKYAPGGAMLAAHSSYPVVPVAHNAGEFWPKRGFLKKPGTIRVVIGPQIESEGKSASEINRLAESWIENEMSRISSYSKVGEVV